MKSLFRVAFILVTFFLVACLGAASARQCPAEYLDCSPSGKLKVKGEHVGTQGIISFNADPSLKGPIQIVVTNGGNSTTFTKALERGRDDYSVPIVLRPGTNSIVVKDEKDASETIHSFNWEGEAASGAGTLGFAAQQPSASSKIAVAADRLDSNSNVAHLRIFVDPTVKGYDILVTDESQTDPLRKEIFHRTRTNIERGDDVLLENVNLFGTGERQVRVRPLKRDGSVDTSAENTVTLTIPAASAANLRLAETPRQEEPPPEYDWGRVRGYFASGVMFSKERDNFSKSDIFLSFTLDKNYLKKDWGWFKDINTFFNARITALPVSAPTPTETPAAGATPTPTPCSGVECDTFISSQKAAVLEVGVYLPMYWDFMTWKRDVTRVGRSPRKEDNALFIAPMAKGGVATITGTSTTAEASRFGGDDVFNFFSFGARIGHFRTHRSRDLAPELISWLDLSVGRWEHFEFEEPVLDAAGRTLKDSSGNDIKVRRRPWRYEARGALRIPETPFLIGFEGNFGKGPDDLRFIFGTRFDIAKVLKTLKIADANDSLGRAQPPQ
jgi:hypothetical protein